jgi:molecular chaperone DnaJ
VVQGMAKDYYNILGLKKGASSSQIKSAYRKLARKYHPDVNPGDAAAEKRFKEISEAYAVLNDPEKKKNYDQFGTADASGFNTGKSSGFGFSGFDFSGKGTKSNFSDIFDEIFRGSKTRAKKPNQPQPGQDLQYVVNLSFMDAIKGITTEITLGRRDGCHTCSGKGYMTTGRSEVCKVCGGSGTRRVQSGVLQFERECNACNGSGISPGVPCKSCKGTGTIPRHEKITVRIPPGVDNGSRVRVPGKGDAGTNGGKAGDLYIVTNVSPHDVFSRKGNNIYIEVPITVSEAALGGKLEVPTIDGKATMKIPPSTRSGQRFRLRGRGVPSLRGGTRGDQFVEVRIVLPEIIDERSKELYRQLQKNERWNPRESLFDTL